MNMEDPKPGGPMNLRCGTCVPGGQPIAELIYEYRGEHRATKATLETIAKGCCAEWLGVVKIVNDIFVWDDVDQVELHLTATELDQWSAMFATIAARVREASA